MRIAPRQIHEWKDEAEGRRIGPARAEIVELRCSVRTLAA